MNITMPAAAKSTITSSDIVDALVAIRDELAGGIKPVFVIPRIWELVGRIEVDAASLPPIRGGGHDDRDVWPSSYDDDIDGFRWEPNFEGPSPLSVLAQSSPEFEPTADDLAEMASWSSGLFTAADALVAHGC